MNNFEKLERLLKIDSSYKPDDLNVGKSVKYDEAKKKRPGVNFDEKTGKIDLNGEGKGDVPSKIEFVKSFRDIENDYPAKHLFDRVGIVPCAFNKEDDDIYFALGIDWTFRELTDLGGTRGVNKHPIYEAYKELVEESCGIFKNIDINKLVNSSPIMFNEHTMVVFYQLDKIENEKYKVPYNLQTL